MAGIPNPISFEGAVIGVAGLTADVPRTGLPPERSMSQALTVETGAKDRGSGDTRQMVNALYGGDRLAQTPAKMELWNLSRYLSPGGDPKDPVVLQAFFNPRAMTKTIRVNWTEIGIPGLSHARLQYSHTENLICRFDLVFDALQIAGNSLRGTDAVNRAQRFVESLCYAKDNPQSVADGAPPRVLLYWPQFMSLSCVVYAQEWTYTHFFSNGAPRRFVCSMEMKEIRDARLTSNMVLRGDQRGTDRPTADGIVRLG